MPIAVGVDELPERRGGLDLELDELAILADDLEIQLLRPGLVIPHGEIGIR